MMLIRRLMLAERLNRHVLFRADVDIRGEFTRFDGRRKRQMPRRWTRA